MVFGGMFEQDRPKMMDAYKNPHWDQNSGLDVETLRMKCNELCEEMVDAPKELVKANLFSFILQNAMLDINPAELFVDRINHANILIDIRETWKEEVETTCMSEVLQKNSLALEHRAYYGNVDFSHTTPDWNDIIKLGIPGLLERIDRASQSSDLSEEQKVFYESCKTVYNAVIHYLKRMADKAERMSDIDPKMPFIATSLKNLSLGAPTSMLEAMQLTVIMNYLITYVEGVNVRSIGGIDRLYHSFYCNDLKSGKFTQDQLREIIDYFYCKFTALGATANTPFYLCGIDKNGKHTINELSYILVEGYIKLDIIDPKLHIRYDEDLPDDLLKMLFASIKNGKNSIVFLNDKVMIDSLVKLEASIEDAREYTPIGCYEPAAKGEVPCSCAGRVNLPKVVELVLHRGFDQMTGEKIIEFDKEINTFEDFFDAVKDVISLFVDRTRELINTYETHYMEINPAPLFSGTIEECLKAGKDAYRGGAKYNNTSICAFGMAQAVDAIVAVKKLVFDDKILTMDELLDILKNNWKNYELLRMKCKNLKLKYGNNDAESDRIMLALVEQATKKINHQPNGRGGKYRCGLFSIDWYTFSGTSTGALPDGRKQGEFLSKNLSTVIGQDKNGVTGLINSVTKIDYTEIPNGAVLDVILHSSAVKGDEGLQAMAGILKSFMTLGGMALQFNVLNPAVLRNAQKQPEKYATLQVRLCGWNVHFVNLSEKEQNEFISTLEYREK